MRHLPAAEQHTVAKYKEKVLLKTRSTTLTHSYLSAKEPLPFMPQSDPLPAFNARELQTQFSFGFGLFGSFLHPTFRRDDYLG